ncbi:type II restriction endonuclease Sau3AI [Bifidobacterium lemurum]|uniref:Type II restriction endonuclease Sau3AI n=1 Tax=Bifidobacterium lemurum TaxID=1603886 RepID=A0A261FRB2_9BIFI|nr:Sau3AI family type II restriction endonuclease [Bifidobacterium lemurum]OZG61493.1 type II restriction endonuclease Sau3AI [Bifidobacterium lemurum]QOL35086.1 restriction endonuclease [Bifidobacterium lemurum]
MIRIVKAICMGEDGTFLCLNPKRNGQICAFPGTERRDDESDHDALERLLTGFFDKELAVGSKLCRTECRHDGQKYVIDSFLCYPDKHGETLQDGRALAWLNTSEMAQYQGDPYDQKAIDKVTFPTFGKSIYKTKKAVHNHALDAVGMRLGEIDADNTKNPNNKGYPGNVVEQVWFEHPADNISAPDFPEAGVELKVTPIDYKQAEDHVEYKAGERLVLNIINYRDEHNVSFEESSFWNKNRFLEVIHYLRRNITQKGLEEDRRKYQIKYANLFALDDLDEPDFPEEGLVQFSDTHMARIRQDWNTIHTLIAENRAHELTESLTTTLGTCTKGTSDYRYTTQANGAHAKSRAFCFKQGFMTTILQEYILKKEQSQSLIRDAGMLSNRSVEDIILDYFRPYEHQTMQRIAEHFDLTWQSNKAPKNLAYMLVRRMLNLNGADIGSGSDDDYTNLNAEELGNGQVRVKTITLFHGKPQENFKVQAIPSFKELAAEDWEDSRLYEDLESQRFLLLVFDNENADKDDKNPMGMRFLGAKFWSVPAADLDGDIKSVWEEDVNKIRNGVELEYRGKRVYNNFVKASSGRILHLRPDAGKSQYCAPYRTTEMKDGKTKHVTMNNARQLPVPAKWTNRPLDKLHLYADDYMTKQAWWLNMDYMFQQIQELL